VRLVVYASARGSVRLRQCGSVQQCGSAAVCGSVAVRQCVVVRVEVCGTASGSLRQCYGAAMYGSVRQCAAVRAAVCGSARSSVCLFKFIRLNI